MTSRFAEIDRRLSEVKILTLDIERLPGLARVWDQKTRYLPVSQWTRMPQLLCVAAKWYGQREILFRSAWDDPERMVRDVWGWIDEADILYTFNGDRFDLPHLRGAFLTAGLPPTRPYKSVDLFKVAKQFGFESKSLDHLCYRLGFPGKQTHYDASTAQRALDGDERAQRDMERYNSRDVRITEKAADHLRPWIHTHPVVSPTAGDELRCHACGSSRLKPEPTDYTAQVLTYALYRCQRCHAPVVARHHKGRVGRTKGVKP